MGEYYSKQALIFADGEIRSEAGGSLRRAGMEVGSGVIDTLEALRRSLVEGVLVSFLRDQLISLIDRKGHPLCMVIEAPMKHRLTMDNDPDGLALLRSLITAILVISTDQNYAQGRTNMLLVSEDVGVINKYRQSPESILSLVKIQNEQLRRRIDLLARDSAAFSRSFLIKAISWTELRRNPDSEISGFLAQIQARLNLEKKITVLAAPAVITKDNSPVKIIMPLQNGKFWVDGELRDAHDEWKELSAEGIHITGSLTTKNIKDVTTQIKKLIFSGVGDIKFAVTDDIVIYLGSDCSIDATAAAGLAQLLVTDLSRYKKKKIIASGVNEGILRRSHGFMMIREFVRVIDY